MFSNYFLNSSLYILNLVCVGILDCERLSEDGSEADYRTSECRRVFLFF
jgi:hypothetical protein